METTLRMLQYEVYRPYPDISKTGCIPWLGNEEAHSPEGDAGSVPGVSEDEGVPEAMGCLLTAKGDDAR